MDNFCLPTIAPDLMLNLLSQVDDFPESQDSMSSSSEDKLQSLQLQNLDYPLGARFYEKQEDSHCIPITLEFVGINGDLLGVIASTYDPRTTAQSSSFLVCFNTFENHDTKKFGISKKKLKFFTPQKYHQRHKILGFYKQFGFEQLRNSVVELKNGKQPCIRKNKISGAYSSWFNTID